MAYEDLIPLLQGATYTEVDSGGLNVALIVSEQGLPSTVVKIPREIPDIDTVGLLKREIATVSLVNDAAQEASHSLAVTIPRTIDADPEGRWAAFSFVPGYTMSLDAIRNGFRTAELRHYGSQLGSFVAGLESLIDPAVFHGQIDAIYDLSPKDRPPRLTAAYYRTVDMLIDRGYPQLAEVYRELALNA